MTQTPSAPKPVGLDPSMGGADWLRLLALSVLWGGSFFFVEVALSDLPPLWIVVLRVSLGAAVLWIFILAAGGRPPASARRWGQFATMGVLNNVAPFCLFAYGQTEIASGLAAILNATTPIFTVIIASVLLADERLTKGKLVGVVIGFLGVAILIGPSAFAALDGSFWTKLACLFAAISYAFAGVYGRRFAQEGVAPIQAAAGQVTASAAFLLPIVFFLHPIGTFGPVSAETWAAIAGLALLSTALAYGLYFRILATAGATNILLVTFLIPISSIGLGISLLGEAISAYQVAGMAVIGCGLVFIDGRLLRRVLRSA